MSVLCPSCKKEPLFYVIEQKIAFSIKDIGFHDAVPEEQVDLQDRRFLECLGCNWRGWIDDYHQAKHGVIKLFQEIPEYDNSN